MIKKAIFLIALLAPLFLSGANGDTTHVISHNNILVITNPSLGSNGYKAWATFPTPSTSVRKIFVTMSYKCPTGWNCGEWDYLDYVKLRRKGGVNAPDKNMEIVRFITPYGNTFTSTWNFNWHIDITEYADFLQDSVEIEYVHTGYETNNGKGWVVKLDFSVIEGTPVAPYVGFTNLFEGVFPYGDPANSIENYLTEDTVTANSSTAMFKLKVTQSGHAAGTQYCAEFCNKYRQLFYDGILTNTHQVWRLCGGNALYPQGGTWVYDRANWCPGAIVYPQVYKFNVAGNSTHRFNFNMQGYTNSDGSQWPNYVLTGHLFEYGAPTNTNDASIEEVYQPSTLLEYARQNPICKEPIILIRNNGSNALATATIEYGIEGSALQSFTYNGNLSFGDTTSLKLPALTFQPSDNNAKFISYIKNVNGVQDQYLYDDTARVKITVPPVYDSVFLIYFYTNLVPSENAYELKDENGNVIVSRIGSMLSPQTTYRDTVHLNAGCYTIRMTDTGGDGLSWWANSAQGNGQFKLKKLNTGATTYFKTFGTDFGGFTQQNFIVNRAWTVGAIEEKQEMVFNIFPNPANDIVNIEFFDLSQSPNASLTVLNSLGEEVIVNKIQTASDDIIRVDVSALRDGVYFFRITSQQQSTTKKVILSH